jgi:hypothetical protein
MNTKMKLNYELVKQQRDHLLSILWHDDKGTGVHGLLDEEIGWGIIDMMDMLISEQESEKNEIFH